MSSMSMKFVMSAPGIPRTRRKLMPGPHRWRQRPERFPFHWSKPCPFWKRVKERIKSHNQRRDHPIPKTVEGRHIFTINCRLGLGALFLRTHGDIFSDRGLTQRAAHDDAAVVGDVPVVVAYDAESHAVVHVDEGFGILGGVERDFAGAVPPCETHHHFD